MKFLGDPAYPYFLWQYNKTIHKFLTEKWWILQGKTDEEALSTWLQVMKVLEFDIKSHRDMFLLIQSGYIGRTHANKLLWRILTGPAIDEEHRDLNNLVTNWIYRARRDFDRPPREHKDLAWWDWTCYKYLYKQDRKWAPDQVPTRAWTLHLDPGDKPLRPPMCWGTHQ